MIHLREIEQAAQRLQNVIHYVPLSSSKTFSDIAGAEVWLKYENQQKTGSFKVRGAYNKIMKLHEEGKVTSVVASSAGNHAQGVAFAAQSVGIDATIVMPRTAPMAKVAATRGYGANVELYGNFYDDAFRRAMEIQEEKQAAFIHPFDDEDVIAGQGTIGMEILQDLPSVDVVLVPAGGGGLLAGVASCIKQLNPRVKIIGVQAEGASAIVESFQAGQRVVKENIHTIADGIAVKAPGELTTEIIRECVDDMVTVSDEEIAAAILLLLERSKQVVEPSGAAPLAAVLNQKGDWSGKRVVCILSGGNIDVSFIHRIVEKGLINRGRNMKFQAVLRDVPGSLEQFAGIMSRNNANITMIQYDRVKTELDLDEVILHVVCEVDGFEHAHRLILDLETEGYRVTLESN